MGRAGLPGKGSPSGPVGSNSRAVHLFAGALVGDYAQCVIYHYL